MRLWAGPADGSLMLTPPSSQRPPDAAHVLRDPCKGALQLVKLQCTMRGWQQLLSDTDRQVMYANGGHKHDLETGCRPDLHLSCRGSWILQAGAEPLVQAFFWRKRESCHTDFKHLSTKSATFGKGTSSKIERPRAQLLPGFDSPLGSPGG